MKKTIYKYIDRYCAYLNRQVKIEAAIESMPNQDEWTVTYRYESPHCKMENNCVHVGIGHYPKATTSLAEVFKKVENHA